MDTKELKNNEVETENIPQDSTTTPIVAKDETNSDTNIVEETNITEDMAKELAVKDDVVKTESDTEADEENESTEEKVELVEEEKEAIIEGEKEDIASDSTENTETPTDEEVDKNVTEEVTEGTTTEVAAVSEEVTENKKVDYDSLSMEDLASALTELVKTENIESIKMAVGSIKSNFIKKIKQIKQDHYDKHIANGGVEDDYKTINFDYEDVYRSAYNVYKEKRRAYIEQLEKMKAENLIKKNDLLENLRNMINSEENLNTVYKEFQKLQEDWREIGLVPQGDVKNLWDNYHFLVDKFFDKVKINKELMMIGLNKNLEAKILLCEKTEELLLEKSINKSFLTLQEFHTKWKEIGPVPNEKNEEIWERFKNASDKINERRQKHYEEMHEEQLQNLHLKTALCEKVEAVVESLPEEIKHWNKMTDDINAIFTEWKTLGPTPKKYNDEIWKRFKTSMNDFFNEKKNFFGKLKDEQMNNYHIKLDLVAQANAIKDSQEWKNTAQTLINLQKKWKTIGPIPRKYSNSIWKDFRSACDHFFNSKDEFFKNINVSEKENKAKKTELLENFEKQEFTDDSKANLELIKTYQRDWINIGRVPMKDKNNLQSKFQKVVDKHLDELNIDRFEFQNAALKSKIESADDPIEAERMIQKEINFIKGKVESIVKDVTLWETNMSFFSNSKNADLLKADFEKKINKAKNDIKSFKNKLRQYDKMKRSL